MLTLVKFLKIILFSKYSNSLDIETQKYFLLLFLVFLVMVVKNMRRP